VNKSKNEDTKIKELIISEDNSSADVKSDVNKDFEENLIEKIKNN